MSRKVRTCHLVSASSDVLWALEGLLNINAVQEIMGSQSLAYQFPFSCFAFPTDISCIVLAEGKKSAFFKAGYTS